MAHFSSSGPRFAIQARAYFYLLSFSVNTRTTTTILLLYYIVAGMTSPSGRYPFTTRRKRGARVPHAVTSPARREKKMVGFRDDYNDRGKRAIRQSLKSQHAVTTPISVATKKKKKKGLRIVSSGPLVSPHPCWPEFILTTNQVVATSSAHTRRRTANEVQ